MTPYEKAEDLLARLIERSDDLGVTLPLPRYAVLGEPVVDCASTIIALTGMAVLDEFDSKCSPPQMGTFAVIVSRDCAVTYDNEGRTIVREAVEASKRQSEDADLLWSFGADYLPYVSKTWDVGFALTGGLAITSLNLRTGID